jgi:hypothetical protein
MKKYGGTKFRIMDNLKINKLTDSQLKNREMRKYFLAIIFLITSTLGWQLFSQQQVVVNKGVQIKCLDVAERGNIEVKIEAGVLTSGIYTYLLIGDSKTSDAKNMILTK